MADDERGSSDARLATYEPDPEAEEQNPPSGPSVIQKRGTPTTGGTKKSTKSAAAES
jgi:hypothetical protein